jgi:hypothetical protein
MTESKQAKWRFQAGSDSNYKDNQHITWVNVDSPTIGSMCIWHDSSASAKEATDRAKLIASAPGLLAENERLRSAIEYSLEWLESCRWPSGYAAPDNFHSALDMLRSALAATDGGE